MTKNRLITNAPAVECFDKQTRCDVLNREVLTHKQGRFYYVKDAGHDANGQVVQTIEWMEIPGGTKGWMRENAPRVKGLIRKITGGSPALVDEVYQRALDAAPVPIPWEKMRVI
jgi:hypothetical protein